MKKCRQPKFLLEFTSNFMRIHYKSSIHSRRPMILAFKDSFLHQNNELLEWMAPITENPNAHFYSGLTPIFVAVREGYTDVVRILAPLAQDPNAANYDGFTPIQLAAREGKLDVIKLLAPLSKEPNKPTPLGESPIYLATDRKKNLDIIKILLPYTDDCNVGNKYETILHCSARLGYFDIVKLIAPLCKNHDAASSLYGTTAIQIAKKNGYKKIVNFLMTMKKKY